MDFQRKSMLLNDPSFSKCNFICFFPDLNLSDIQESLAVEGLESPVQRNIWKKIFDRDKIEDFRTESFRETESLASHKKSTQLKPDFTLIDHKLNLFDKDALSFLSKRLDTLQEKFLSNDSL